MTRIRVDTEELRKSAKELTASADSIGRAGDEILAVALSLPPYEGQLSGPARKAGYEIQTQLRDLKTCLAGDADTVNKAAQAYEEVDNRAIRGITQNQEILSSALLSPTHPPQQGNAYLGYRDDGKSEYVILCIYGTCRRVKREGNEADIEAFESAVDDYYTSVEAELNAAALLLAAGASTVGGIAAAGAATAPFGGVGAPIAALVGAAALFPLWQQEATAEKKVREKINDATYAWNKLFGENAETDDKQTPWDLWNRKSEEIYEPGWIG